jgi:hypothetical protein
MTIQPSSSHHQPTEHSTAPKPPAPKTSQEQPQDSVHLSSKAKSSGDAEHKGEGH